MSYNTQPEGGDNAALIGQVTAQLTQVTEDLRTSAERYEHDRSMNEQTKNKVDELLLKHGELNAQLTELEQKQSARTSHASRPMSLGEQVLNDEKMKMINSGNFDSKVVVKINNALTSSTADADGSAGALIAPERQAGVVAAPERKMTIRDLLMPGKTKTGLIEYVKEKGFTNNAAVVAEGQTKPESSLQFELVEETAKTIAHWVPASKQILDDAPQLMSYIDGRLRYGLAYVEEQQFLNGSGTGGDISGLMTEASAYSAAFTVASENIIDKLRLAALQVALAEYAATGFVLNPIDWAKIETTKNANNDYIIGKPDGEGSPRLWNLPVIETQAIAANNFLTGSFNLGAQIFDRQGATLDIATTDQDDFINNMIKIRLESRAALAIYRPEAFVTGTLVAV